MAKWQGIAAIAAVLFTCATGSQASSCKPMWKHLSEGKALAVDSGAYTVKFSAILIGCEQSMAMLKDVEIKKMQDALKIFLGERSLDLIGAIDSRKLRSDAAAAMNRSLRKGSSHRCFFCVFAVGEAM